MALVLHIDTAGDTASVCLAKGGKLLSLEKNEIQKDHAVWLHPAIEKTIKQTGHALNEINAVAVTIGPGSYTGLRVGLAAAKGLCYALQKPLITINTLQMMANAAKDEASDLICPMIDARRMEVFTALYDKNLQPVTDPAALILNEKIFSGELASHPILFLGNGSGKFKPLCNSPNAVFTETIVDASHMILLSEKSYTEKIFADLAYCEPFYLKEFHTAGRQPLI